MRFRERSLMRFCAAVSLVFLYLISGGATVRGDEPQGTEQPDRVRELEARVADLEKTVAELKTMIQAANRSAGPPAANALAGPPAANTNEPARIVATNPAPLPESEKPRHFETPPELLPEVGKIGAEVGIIASASTSPFKLGTGNFAGGFIDLPLFDRPHWLHGKVSYEILVGLTQSQTTFTTTSNVAQVANLAVLNTLFPNGGLSNVQAATSGTGPAPFPVSVSTQTRLRLLQVIPFALKYSPTFLDRYRIRPYVVAGFGTYVTIHVQNPARGTPASFGVRPDADLPPGILAAVNSLFGGKAPFGGPLVAGQISQSPELEARGLPGGHGNIDLGYQAGGGISFRVSRGLSLGFDARYNRIAGTYGNFVTYGSRIGVHF